MTRPRHKWDPVCDPPPNLARPVRVDPTGRKGPSPKQARGRRWRALGNGWYVRSSAPDLPEQRVVEAAVLLPPGAAVTGWASGRMLGASFMDGLLPDGRTRQPVPFAVPPERHPRRRDAVRHMRSPLDPSEIAIRQGVRCVRPERAAFDAMRTASSVREAVVELEKLMAARLTSIRRARAYVLARPGWEGVALAREGLDLAAENSRSPNETRMRLIWELDAGFPHPLVNRHVWTRDGRLLGIADLLDPVAGVVGEYDGADHRDARRHSDDEDRADGFRQHGLEVFRVTGPDLHDRARVVARMAAARARAKWLPPKKRPWTLEPPPGWDPGPTLDQELDERDAARAEHEQFEAERERWESDLAGWA